MFRTFMVMSLATATIFTACKKDDADSDGAATIEEVKITLNAIPSSTSIPLNTAVKLVIEATGNDKNKLKSIRLTSSQESKTLLDTAISGTSYTKTIDLVLNKVGSHVFTATLTGEKEGGSVTASYTINVTAPTSYSDVELLPDIVLGNQFAQQGSSWSVAEGVLEWSEAGTKQASVDLIYGSRSSTNGNAIIGSPASADVEAIYSTKNWNTDFSGSGVSNITNWTVRNETQIVKLPLVTTAAFDQASNDSIMLLNENLLSTSTQSINEVVNNTVFLFKTVQGKLAIAKITQISGAYAPSPGTSGTVTFSVKIQK